MHELDARTLAALDGGESSRGLPRSSSPTAGGRRSSGNFARRDGRRRNATLAASAALALAGLCFALSGGGGGGDDAARWAAAVEEKPAVRGRTLATNLALGLGEGAEGADGPGPAEREEEEKEAQAAEAKAAEALPEPEPESKSEPEIEPETKPKSEPETKPEPEKPAENAPAKEGRNPAVPAALADHLADLSGPASDLDSGIPTFWHVLKAGGTAVQDMSQHCFALRVASEIGARDGAGEEDELRLVGENEYSLNVNVDTTTREGIDRAGRLGLASSGLVDALFTPELVPAAGRIFSPQHKGRMFALFRHPVHRVVSQFYYLQRADWEPTYNPAFKDMTLEEWAFTPYVESNWMVRALVDKWEAPLTNDDVMAALEIVEAKCLVGLTDRMEESVERFRTYFGFGTTDDGSFNPDADECVNQWLGNDGDGDKGNRNRHPMPEEGGKAWNELERKNGADMILYKHVQKLWQEQGALVEREERRRIDKKQRSDSEVGEGPKTEVKR